MEVITTICKLILLICAIIDVISAEESRDDCPVGNYHCNSANKVCIALNKICDGKNDCPNGDDELTSYCKQVSLAKDYKNYNPGKNYVKESNDLVKISNPKLTKTMTRDDNWADGENPYWINNGCAAGNYLCNGTLNICVKMSDICNGRQDCPQADDEDKEICDKWPQPKSNTLSQPKSNTLSQPESNEFSNFKSNALSQMSSNPLMDKLIGSSSPYRNFAGTGFMFHVDNLIIYNSDVKMFNQNSDNENK